MGRKRGSRFRKTIDAQKQLEQIEEAQERARRKRPKQIIERIDKSEKRWQNVVKKIDNCAEAREEFK
jgi:hypothetical protein